MEKIVRTFVGSISDFGSADKVQNVCSDIRHRERRSLSKQKIREGCA